MYAIRSYYAVNSYRFVFEQPVRPANSYRLKYALALQANGQYSEFKKVIKEYSDLVELEIGSGNTLVSAENRTKLYKDTAVSFVANGQSETVAFKVKYAGYKMRRQEHPEDKYLNLILSNGTEHSVAPSDGDNFEFNFQPQEVQEFLFFENRTDTRRVIVQTHDVRKVYKMGKIEVHALRGVGLSIFEGES